jgi:hypothetical protein
VWSSTEGRAVRELECPFARLQQAEHVVTVTGRTVVVVVALQRHTEALARQPAAGRR